MKTESSSILTWIISLLIYIMEIVKEKIKLFEAKWSSSNRNAYKSLPVKIVLSSPEPTILNDDEISKIVNIAPKKSNSKIKNSKDLLS